jgi:FKBP-type peptidyl-prolyl cis-trans isomerase FkpA
MKSTQKEYTMKKIIILAIALLVVNIGCSGSSDTEKADKPITLETTKQKASYALGYNIGRNLANFVEYVDMDIVIQGLKDSALKNKEKIPMKDMQEAYREFSQEIGKRMEEKRRIEGEKNKVEGEAWLNENAKKEGVKVTESGLQYMVLTEGTGPKPKTTDSVKVDYKGTLMDGTEFDSSYKRGQPAVFLLNRMIPGWIEGIPLMSVGSKYKFFIPPNLAYGENGRPPMIPPSAVLIFEVELLGIEPPAEKKPETPAPKTPPKETKK